MKSLSFDVPAKINAYLRLTGKRSDGYNNLCTVFQKIDLCDRLVLKKQPRGFHLDVIGDCACSPKQNLVYKAYSLIKKKTKFTGGISATITKNIPSGAGLGGASSDAAYMLMGINRLYKLGLNHTELLDLGRKIGSDVPFFMQPYACGLGIERGDVTIELPTGKPLWVLLVVFSEKLITKTVYEHFTYPQRHRLNLTKLSREVIMLSQFLRQREVVSLSKLLINDLTKISCVLMPEIKKVFHALKQSDIAAYAMSGSGPTVFALFRSKKDVETASEKLLSYMHTYHTLIVCRTLH